MTEAQPEPPEAVGPQEEPPAGAPREARRLSPLTPLVRGAIVVVAMLATSWDDLLAGQLGPVGLILLAVLVVGGVVGYASWLRTKYWIEGDELRIDTGVVSQQSRRIRIDRLQGIDIVQPFVARLFGLAELRMDTAGGDREGSLAFLPLSEAQRLRETLLARRDAVRRREPAERDAATGQPAWAPPDHDIATLDLRTLLLSNLLSPGSVVIALGTVAFGVVSIFGGVGVLFPVAPVLVGFVLVQGRRFSAHYGFTVAQTGAGLQVRRGLLERSTQTIALVRVQGVLITEPWMWRPWGWARLDVSMAGYGSGADSDGEPSATAVMPVASRELAMRLAQHLLRGGDARDREDGLGDREDGLGDREDGLGDREDRLEVDPDAVPTAAPPERARWLDPLTRRFLTAGLGQDVVVSREGRLTRRTHVARHARVQSLRLSQGPLQRRLGLADLHLDSPPGPVHVRFRHRDAAEARVLLERARTLARAAR